ncbi:hypothetical protein J3R83DRAFT_10690 [Lanmaoa asiatica]|nr:hypothetical protein J3R83DRAFT_10690 [Lanmaoa asiatica]
MSDTPQDENTPRAESTAAAKERPATERQFESTPAKKKYGPDLAFASTAANYEKVRKQLASEMEGRWLGAMPVDDFLHTYLRTAGNSAPLPTLAEDPFGAVPSSGVESSRYDPFITAIAGWIPHLQAVNTSTKEDTANKLKLKPDISLYNRVEGVAPANKTDFSRIELWMEFKTNSSGVAFRDPDDTTDESRRLAIEQGSFTPATVDGIDARGQLAHYAGAQHSLQFRHFSFSIVVEGDRARFLRWDPAGTVVTAAFNYRTSPEILAEFLWRFDQLEAKGRGHDESIRPAELEDDVDGRVREKLEIKDNKIPLFEYDLPGLDGMGHAYGPRPPYQNRSLVSRCTRSLPVVWIPRAGVKCGTNSCTESEPVPDTDLQPGEENSEEEDDSPWSRERIVFMKDTWRFLSDLPDIEVLPEHEIYCQASWSQDTQHP